MFLDLLFNNWGTTFCNQIEIYFIVNHNRNDGYIFFFFGGCIRDTQITRKMTGFYYDEVHSAIVLIYYGK